MKTKSERKKNILSLCLTEGKS